jgi:hypothetical protein
MIYVPTFLQGVFTMKDRIWPSSIPLIILDTEHPWLAANKTWLSRYPNVRTDICNKDSDLWTKPSSPERALPSDLFTKINIDNNKSGLSRFGWKNAAERLQELKNCPAALQDIKELNIYVYVHDSEFDTWTESTLPPRGLPHLFAELLSRMPNLETLQWGIEPTSTHLFEAAFADTDVTLLTVKHIVPAAYSEWLVRRCPNLQSLRAGCFFDHSS